MTLLRVIMVNVPYLKKNSPKHKGNSITNDEKRGPLQIRVMLTSGEREMDFEMDEIGGIIVIVRFTQMFN